mgnify:CR=1 FL=1
MSISFSSPAFMRRLILKAGDKAAGADLQIEVFALAAVESHAVVEALEVDGGGVALFGVGNENIILTVGGGKRRGFWLTIAATPDGAHGQVTVQASAARAETQLRQSMRARTRETIFFIIGSSLFFNRPSISGAV